MFREILAGLLVALVLLYMFYLYLAWCSKYSVTKVLYTTNPSFVLATDKAVIESYGSLMLPEYLSDTYKPIRFWILYNKARYL